MKRTSSAIENDANFLLPTVPKLAAVEPAPSSIATIEPAALVAPMARLSVEVPADTLLRLKIAAHSKRRTVRELVLDWLARDGYV